MVGVITPFEVSFKNKSLIIQLNIHGVVTLNIKNCTFFSLNDPSVLIEKVKVLN